jgi:membrane-associated phospholipid phosphatase
MEIIKKHRAYFALYFPFLLIAGYLVFVYSKSSIHLYFNQFHTPFFDWVFKYLTYLGDGWAIVFMVLLYLLFINIRQGLFIGLSTLFASAITQVLKHFVFKDSLRPSAYFNDIDPHALYLVEGVDLHTVYSLPSGHTTAAFAMTASIAFMYNSRKIDTSMFILGALIGYSRIYLSQHFLEDVFMGSIIGVLGAIVIYSLLYSPKMLAKTRLNQPLINWKKND